MEQKYIDRTIKSVSLFMTFLTSEIEYKMGGGSPRVVK